MMMRRGMMNGTDALETINAAASVIASSENRDPDSSFQKRRWGICLSISSCFGSQKNKRIGHAVLVPEPTTTQSDTPTIEHPSQPPSIVFPFIAPPSSPASFLPSEPPSAMQSPNGIFSLNSISANMYSPSGPASIFAIGPYAHETQLVSPPVFSTFTTEPSTAPYTPPPESVHLTTPSSPEVPFARLLEPNLQNSESGQRYPYAISQYEFQSYQLQPGSPVSHLISPCSGISGSGTSSPFPDCEVNSGHPFFLQFRASNRPNFLDLDKIVLRECESRQESGSVTPDAVVGPISVLDRQHSDVSPLPNVRDRLRNNDAVLDHRVSFEMTAEEVVRCVETKPVSLPKAVQESSENVDCPEEEKLNTNECQVKEADLIEKADCEKEKSHRKNRTFTLGSAKEFNFDNVDGGSSGETSISTDWWVNEKVVGEDVVDPACNNNWSFFPMVQTGAG